MKANFRTNRTQVSLPASAGNVANMCELQAQNCMTPQQWTRLLCSVNVISENKTVIARITSIKLLTQVFYKFLVFSPNFQVVANSHFVPAADTHEHRRMPNTEAVHQIYLLSLITK